MDDLRAGRGDPWEHDPGPPRNRRWAWLFAETPDYRGLDAAGSGSDATGVERFRWQFGPVFYRGRLGDNQVKVLVVGQDAGSDEALGHRAFVGESGSRVQHLLSHLGIPIDQPPTGATWDGERVQIPRADLPFGFPRWQGSSGDRVVRAKKVAGADPQPEAAYKVWVPRWVDALPP